MKKEKIEIKGRKGGDKSRQADLSWRKESFPKEEMLED